MPRLTHLDLSANRLEDLSFFESMTHLTGLNLGSNHITDCTPLTGLTALTSLVLCENRLDTCAPLAALGQLESLDLAKNLIRDAAPLAHLTNLKKLNLQQNPISDCSPLAALSNLEDLDLSQTEVVDLSWLHSLPALKDLNPPARLGGELSMEPTNQNSKVTSEERSQRSLGIVKQWMADVQNGFVVMQKNPVHLQWNALLKCLSLGETPSDALLEACKASRDDSGETILHYALKGASDFEKLIGLGFDLNVQDKAGRTPAMEAVYWSDWASIRLLIDHGARLDLQDDQGRDLVVLILDSEKQVPKWLAEADRAYYNRFYRRLRKWPTKTELRSS